VTVSRPAIMGWVTASRIFIVDDSVTSTAVTPLRVAAARAGSGA
jgi:hypothetical protein